MIFGQGASVCGLDLKNAGDEMHYFGDLDAKGVSIAKSLFARHGNLKPASWMYRFILDNGRRRPKKGGNSLSGFCDSWFGEIGAEIAAMLSDGFWICQETLGWTQLREMICADRKNA